MTAKATASNEDELRLQIAILKTQLAESMKTAARCEADGPQWQRTAQEASDYGQVLLKDLDAHGFMLDSQNKIVQKPKPAPSKP